MTESIRPFYADWADYNRRTVEGLGALSPDDLALRASGSDHWPIWAIASHMAGAWFPGRAWPPAWGWPAALLPCGTLARPSTLLLRQ